MDASNQKRKETFRNATRKRMEKIDRITFRAEKGFKDSVIKKHVEKTGESINTFIMRAILETIESDSGKTEGIFVLPQKAANAFAKLGLTQPCEVRDYMLYDFGKKGPDGKTELKNVGKKTAELVVNELYRCGFLDDAKKEAALTNIEIRCQRQK